MPRIRNILQADRTWAEWIAWQLEENGYRVLIQAWDMVPGNNWTHRMQQGIRQAKRTVAVLSACVVRLAVAGSVPSAATKPEGALSTRT